MGRSVYLLRLRNGHEEQLSINVFNAHLIPQNLETYLHQSGWEKGRTDLILQGNESIQTTQRGSM